MLTDERRRRAQDLIDNPLLTEILSGLETAAVDRCVYAASTDHDMRAAAAAEVRAIRAFRQNLVASARDNLVRKPAPA